MKPAIRPFLSMLVVAAAAFTGTVEAEAACLSAQEARKAVASGEAVRLGRVARRVGGDIVDAQLCEQGGRLVYRLAVLTEGGAVQTILVDARTGQPLN